MEITYQKTVATTLLAVRNFKIQFMEVSLISKALSWNTRWENKIVFVWTDWHWQLLACVGGYHLSKPWHSKSTNFISHLSHYTSWVKPLDALIKANWYKPDPSINLKFFVIVTVIIIIIINILMMWDQISDLAIT